MRLLVSVALLCVVLVAGAARPALAEPPKPAILDQVGVDQKLGVQVPLDLVLRDESWRSVKLGDLFEGKPVILTLNYYNCKNICSTELDDLIGKLGDVAFEVGKQYTIVSVSINPRETPQIASLTKKSFVKRYARPGVDQAWHFMTADEAAIQTLTETVGFRYAYNADLDEYAHPAAIMVLTPEGKVAQYLYSPVYSATDLRLALVESSQNKIGTVVDKVLLYCYRYDPTAGKYSAAILNIIRLGGVVTMLALGVFLFVSLRHDFGRRPSGA